MNFMKIENFKKTAMLLLSAMFVVSISSCHKDDEETISTKKDDNAGTFTLVNLTGKEEISGNSVSLFKDDTLKFIFTPKEKYKTKEFEIECVVSNIDFLKKNSDSTFIVGVQQKVLINPSLILSASCSYIENNTSYVLSAKDTISLPVPNSLTRKGYLERFGLTDFFYTISSNILQFVTPIVSYTNGQGEVLIDNNSPLEENETVTVYKDGNGKEYFFNKWSLEEPNSKWAKVEEYSYPCIGYYYQEKYNLGREYNVLTVKYEPKSEINPLEEEYIFVRNLYVGLSLDKNLIIIDRVSKEKLTAYIEKLASNPDVINIFFDKNGNATEK